MKQKFYISKENQKAFDKLVADGYKLIEGIKEYHPKHSEKHLIRPVIGIADVYWVDWTGNKKQFEKYMDDNSLRLHKPNGLKKESILIQKDINKYNL